MEILICIACAQVGIFGYQVYLTVKFREFIIQQKTVTETRRSTIKRLAAGQGGK